MSEDKKLDDQSEVITQLCVLSDKWIGERRNPIDVYYYLVKATVGGLITACGDEQKSNLLIEKAVNKGVIAAKTFEEEN